MSNSNWFEVDRVGLAQLLGDRGPGALIVELVANAWDAPGVSRVEIRLEPVASAPYANVRVSDNSPTGFEDITHAFTLFAPSLKKAEPTQRGRFNLGEKLVLALCKSAKIISTKSAIAFASDGRRPLSERTEAGTVFDGVVRMTRNQLADVERLLARLISPVGIVTTVVAPNHSFVLDRSTMDVPTTVKATLATVLSDEEGILRPTRRSTTVDLWPCELGEEGWVFELGVPVVEIGGTHHVDVQQKVPLNMERDNVPAAYRRALHALVLGVTPLTRDGSREAWVTDALPLVDDITLTKVLDARFGEKRVSFDPNDLEANSLAASQGYTVVHGGSLPSEVWQAVREANAIRPAGRVTPSNKAAFAEGGKDVTVTPDKWPTGALALVRLFENVGVALLGHAIEIQVVNDPRAYAACYGSRSLLLNLRRLGKEWFASCQPGARVEEKHLDLLLHELAHEFAEDHFSEAYHKALSRLGAKLALMSVGRPELLTFSG